MSSQTITIRTERNTVEKIGAIAQAMDRSRNWVIEGALRQYIDHQAWYLEGIEQARDSLKAALIEGQGREQDAEAWQQKLHNPAMRLLLRLEDEQHCCAI